MPLWPTCSWKYDLPWQRGCSSRLTSLLSWQGYGSDTANHNTCCVARWDPLCDFQYYDSLLDGTDVKNCKQQKGCVYAVIYFIGRQHAGRNAIPLLPRMKASPYLFLSWPCTYSCKQPNAALSEQGQYNLCEVQLPPTSVCSIAMFIYPSKQARIPAKAWLWTCLKWL